MTDNGRTALAGAILGAVFALWLKADADPDPQPVSCGCPFDGVIHTHFPGAGVTTDGSRVSVYVPEPTPDAARPPTA